MRCPYDLKRRQRSFCIARPVPEAPRPRNSTRPLPGRGGDQGVGRPRQRPALPRTTHVWVRSTQRRATGRPDGQGIFGVPIVPVHFAYAAATTAAPCPTDAWPLRLDIVRLAWTDRPVGGIAGHGTITIGQPARFNCRSAIVLIIAVRYRAPHCPSLHSPTGIRLPFGRMVFRDRLHAWPKAPARCGH